VADIAKTKYGEAGVEQRDFIGINPISTNWDINVNIRNFQEVDDFLRSRRGQPFRLSLDGGVSDDGKFYICTEWQIQQLGVSAGNFSAKITQVRRFIYIPEPEPDIINPVFLLSGNGANNANNFRDFYGRALNPSGNSIYSTAQSKWNNSALYFDGNSYIQSPLVPELTFGSGDLTWEAWVYVTQAVFDTGYQAIFGNTFGTGSGNAGLFLALTTNYKFVFRHWVDGYSNATSTQTINLNTWYHVACTKSGTVLEIFVNGIKGTSGSTSLFNTDYAFNLGRASNPGGYAANFIGYLDDIRLTKGLVIYTSNFSIPTQEFFRPIDPYQNNNVLLLDFDGANGSTSFYDYCGKKITSTGNIFISTTQSKYAGSSLFLNGSNDILNVTSTNNEFAFPGDFTCEGWFYVVSNSSSLGTIFFYLGTSENFGRTQLGLDPDGKLWIETYFTSVSTRDTNIYPLNQWNHVAFSRQGNTLRIFLNGNLVATGANGDSLGHGGGMSLGGGSDNRYNGYMDNIRVTKGVARYINSFTPDNHPAILERDPDIDKVVLLMHMNGVNGSTTFPELTNKVISSVDTTISNTQSKFNGSSGFFNGSTSYLETANSSDLNLSSADNFTIEAWVYKTTTGTVGAICSNIVGVASRGFGFLINSDDRLRFQSDGASPDIYSNLTVPLNQWTHVSISKSGSNYTFSVNGIVETLNNTSTWIDSSSTIFRIGRTPRNDFPYSFAGYIDEFRITKGLARYTSNFTPRTRPFPNIN
jgi:phage-related protein